MLPPLVRVHAVLLQLPMTCLNVVHVGSGICSTALDCAPEDIALFASRPWTDMLEDLELNGANASDT